MEQANPMSIMDMMVNISKDAAMLSITLDAMNLRKPNGMAAALMLVAAQQAIDDVNDKPEAEKGMKDIDFAVEILREFHNMNVMKAVLKRLDLHTIMDRRATLGKRRLDSPSVAKLFAKRRNEKDQRLQTWQTYLIETDHPDGELQPTPQPETDYASPAH